MTTRQVTSRAFNLCSCGCGAEIGPRSRYAPGHDARHVSELYRQMIAGMDREASWYERGAHYRMAITRLESPALKAKFRKRVADAGWRHHQAAAASMLDQWFTPRLPELLAFNGDRGFDGGARTAAGVLAVIGFNRVRVNHKYS